MSNRTNFLKGSTNPQAELRALDEICIYLVSIGKYENTESAKTEALERVGLFKELGLYKNDPGLSNASPERKSVHALIYGHDLHDLLVENNGYLPETSETEHPKSDSMQAI